MSATQRFQSVYFDEGDGFHYIKQIGTGQDGNVVLVSTGPEGKCLARKEANRHQPITNRNGQWYLEPEQPLRPGHKAEDAMGEDLSQPPKEARISKQLASVDGACKVRGWCRRIDTVNRSVVTSTYWDYYNGGSLKDLKEDILPLNEYWVSYILLTMADTMIRIHKAGVAHRDNHSGNWFWEHLLRPDGDDQVNVVLGDFQRSRPKEQCGSNWTQYRRIDYSFLVEICLELLDLPYSHAAAGGSNRSMLPYDNDFPCTQSFWNLLCDLRDIANKDSSGDPIQEMEVWMQRLESYHDQLKAVSWPDPRELPESDDEDIVEEWFIPLGDTIELFRNNPAQQPKYWKIAITGNNPLYMKVNVKTEEFLLG